MEHEQDPAMALHLVVVLLFQQHTNCMLHAPGRMVPAIVTILEKYLPEEEQKILLSFQKLIIKYITAVRNTKSSSETLNGEPRKSNTESDTDGTGDKEEGENTEDNGKAEETDNDPTILLSKLNNDLPLVKAMVLKPKKDQ